MLKSPYAAIVILLAAIGPLGAWFARGYLDGNMQPVPAPTPLPEISLPGQVTAAVGRQKQIDITGSVPWVEWRLLDKPSAAEMPIDVTPINDGKSVIFTAPTPGIYWLQASGVCKSGKALCHANCEVVVGTGPPPPGPPDPPPTPTDPFFTALSAAWAADTDPAKEANRLLLEGMYATFEVIPAGVNTYGDLFAKMLADEKAALPAGALPAERKAIGAYLNANLPTAPGTTVDKALTAKVFGQVANYLGELK
jgi:hypothetical protein